MITFCIFCLATPLSIKLNNHLFNNIPLAVSEPLMGNDVCCELQHKAGQFNRNRHSHQETPEDKQSQIEAEPLLQLMPKRYSKELSEEQNMVYPSKEKKHVKFIWDTSEPRSSFHSEEEQVISPILKHKPRSANQEMKKQFSLMSDNLEDKELRTSPTRSPNEIKRKTTKELQAVEQQLKKEQQKAQSNIKIQRKNALLPSIQTAINRKRQLQKSKSLSHERSNSKSKKLHLCPEVKQTLKQHNYFGYDKKLELLTSTTSVKQFGKYVRRDGSVYIGQFKQGKAHGKGVFIFPDGSFYEGNFVNNKAQCLNGYYQSPTLTYRGQFRFNVFHGKGQEWSKTHSFNGNYENGSKAKGILKWDQVDEKYVYNGTFNQKGQFHGEGTLYQPHGTYSGDFKNGKKHGQGRYKYSSGLTYQGEYINNRREGMGRLLGVDQRTLFQGRFIDGLPHGEGLKLYKSGKTKIKLWNMGVEQDSEKVIKEESYQ